MEDSGAQNYARFLAGDDDGLVDIIRDYQDGLILFLNRYTENLSAAEELAEETFFRLVTRRPLFAPRCSFKTWLYTIGRNTAISYLRRARKSVPPEQADMAADAAAYPERVYLKKEEQQMLYRALGRIRADYGRVLYLKYFEELTNPQIARIMGKSRRQVENLSYQAKRALQAELSKEDFDYDGSL